MNEWNVSGGKKVCYWGTIANSIYDVYTHRPGGRHVLNQMLKSLEHLTGVSHEQKVLHVGCAAGTQVLELAERGFKKITGMDSAPQAIENAKINASERKMGVGFICGDATNMNMFQDEEFDVVFSFGVMGHIPNLEKALNEQYRILKPGGHIYIQVLNTWCPWHKTGKKLSAFMKRKPEFKKPPAVKTFSCQELETLLKSAGFIEMNGEVIVSVLPECPASLLPVNIILEKILSALPLLNQMQALACVAGRK